MKPGHRPILKLLSIFAIYLIVSSFIRVSPEHINLKFPYKAAGLTDEEAAAHLLNRFSFGATPGQVNQVIKMGLEKWFLQQLDGGLADDSLQVRLSQYDALKLSNTEANRLFPRPAQVARLARDKGIIPKDTTEFSRKEYRKQLAGIFKENNFRRQGELFRQFINYKILRATYSNNQLQEVLTDFWFNHFNVSITKKDCAMFIPAFERDVIRPNVSGKFEDLLLATAKSPAMLLYLDNFTNTAANEQLTAGNEQTLRKRMQEQDKQSGDSSASEIIKKVKNRKKSQGINENYAREVMELHTMGVDGGYTQADVTQAARVLTGWTIFPFENGYGNETRKLIEQAGEAKLAQRGFLHDGDFLFAMNRHDKQEKTVLGKKFAGNRGYDEGVELLKMLAHNPSTASFICRKLAVRFVSDNPSKSLVDKMARTFAEKNGDIKEILITMVSAPEFWDKAVLRDKTKSPFELVISAVRALQSDVQQPYQLFTWMDKMGQRIYYYQAPTGFPDRAQYWINTGALLNRMNFGLSIASPQMRGVKTDLLALNNFHEPESPAAALITYGKLLMPGRDLTATVKRLTPLLTQPSLETKVESAANNVPAPVRPDGISGKMTSEDDDSPEASDKSPGSEKNNKAASYDGMLAQVVGIIIGSPEFQRK